MIKKYKKITDKYTTYSVCEEGIKNSVLSMEIPISLFLMMWNCLNNQNR